MRKHISKKKSHNKRLNKLIKNGLKNKIIDVSRRLILIKINEGYRTETGDYNEAVTDLYWSDNGIPWASSIDLTLTLSDIKYFVNCSNFGSGIAIYYSEN